MTEVIQAQRHGQKSGSHSKADPPLASEAQVPKWQCRKHMPSSKQALKIHRHTRCLCSTLKLFAYAPAWPTFLFFFKTPSTLLWFEQLTSISAFPRSTKWNNTEVSREHPAYLGKALSARTRGQHMPWHEAAAGSLCSAHWRQCLTTLSSGLLVPWGKCAFEPLLGLK